jgi:hypothetical protein
VQALIHSGRATVQTQGSLQDLTAYTIIPLKRPDGGTDTVTLKLVRPWHSPAHYELVKYDEGDTVSQVVADMRAQNLQAFKDFYMVHMAIIKIEGAVIGTVSGGAAFQEGAFLSSIIFGVDAEDSAATAVTDIVNRDVEDSYKAKVVATGLEIFGVNTKTAQKWGEGVDSGLLIAAGLSDALIENFRPGAPTVELPSSSSPWADELAELSEECLGQNCFPETTLVGTESGLRPITSVEAGDRVWSYDFVLGEWRLCAVEKRDDQDWFGTLCTLETALGAVQVTPNHPFWVAAGEDLENRVLCKEVDRDEDRGQSLPGRWVDAFDVRVGDIVFLRGHGNSHVRSVSSALRRIKVCNLTVPELHTFAVGEMQLLVHNTCGAEDWAPGHTGSPEESLEEHFQRHGQEVKTNTIEAYNDKAVLAMNSRRGRGDLVDGFTPNVRRFDVHGTRYYVDVDVVNEKVVSFGSKDH